MKIFFSTLAIVLVMSCKSSSVLQEKNNSNEKISWINEKIEKFKNHPFPKKSSITEYQYKGETVYLVESCYKCPDAQSFLYNEKQEKLCTFGGMVPSTNNCPGFFDVATDKKIIWKNF